ANNNVFFHCQGKAFKKTIINGVMQKNAKILVLIIAVITLVSGVVQIIVPAIILGLIGAEVSSYTTHLFSIVGMFMALFGGMTIHSLYNVQENKIAIFWSGAQ